MDVGRRVYPDEGRAAAIGGLIYKRKGNDSCRKAPSECVEDDLIRANRQDYDWLVIAPHSYDSSNYRSVPVNDG